MHNAHFINIKDVFMDGDKIPRQLMCPIIENTTMGELIPFIDTLEGKFNGRQLRFKKPYVVVEDPIKSTYTLWVENLG